MAANVTLGVSSMVSDVQTIFNSNASWTDKLPQHAVETKHGEQTIGTVKVGEKVVAYNPKTK